MLSLLSLLCLHQSLPGNISQQWRFLCFHTNVIVGWLPSHNQLMTFDPWLTTTGLLAIYSLGTDSIENTTSNNSYIITCVSVAAETCLLSRCLATDNVIMSQYDKLRYLSKVQSMPDSHSMNYIQQSLACCQDYIHEKHCSWQNKLSVRGPQLLRVVSCWCLRSVENRSINQPNFMYVENYNHSRQIVEKSQQDTLQW
jgi:hypothetical protein